MTKKGRSGKDPAPKCGRAGCSGRIPRAAYRAGNRFCSGACRRNQVKPLPPQQRRCEGLGCKVVLGRYDGKAPDRFCREHRPLPPRPPQVIGRRATKQERRRQVEYLKAKYGA